MTLQVEFWSMDGKWRHSSYSGLYSREDLYDVLDNASSTAPRRVRESDDDEWEFFPTRHHPGRYESQDGAIWYTSLDEIPRHHYPVIDLLTREVYASPSTERNTDMPANIPSPPTTPTSLVDIQIKRHQGKLVLALNARPLHEMLDSIGCRANAGAYEDAPSVGFSAIRDNKLSTALFLRREYPVTVNLAQHYSRPATIKELRALCESGHEAVKVILEHYKPVDISYTINKMVASK